MIRKYVLLAITGILLFGCKANMSSEKSHRPEENLRTANGVPTETERRAKIYSATAGRITVKLRTPLKASVALLH